jgi:hypothetical protein
MITGTNTRVSLFFVVQIEFPMGQGNIYPILANYKKNQPIQIPMLGTLQFKLLTYS